MHFPDFRLKNLSLVTERETRYMCVMNEVMIKPDWWSKLRNREEVKRWKIEFKATLLALGSDAPEWHNDPVNDVAEQLKDNLQWTLPKMYSSIEFMFEELEFIAANCIRETPSGTVISPTSIHGVFISDSVVPIKLLSKLNAQASAIEADSLAKQKWNKHSNNTVLDLVHPSDYCAVYGISKLRENIAQIYGIEPVICSDPSAENASAQFQWLPSEFGIDDAGKVRIESYINNLNRRVHNKLYDRLQLSLKRCRYQQGFYEWCEDMAPKMGIFDKDSHEYLDFMNAHWGQSRPIKSPGLPESFDSKNPVYNGGNWHLKGMENEAIGATGIVYYDMSNITSSCITFQSFYDDGCLFYFEQNFLHHKVKDFELEDKTKPGFCRILALFLVHPLLCTYSTRTVAMQQRECVVQDLFDMVLKGILPYEIVESIVQYLGSTFSAAEAAVYAHELSEERNNILPTDFEDE
ncbi:hypothetical protein BJ741DRAFT_703440 [Chytriomyces cf. hyalinus JEL632]|nr:hypothetical protein BJ741DRAFT_703440 [Chytriomyces cf. hyalinus JEL632]